MRPYTIALAANTPLPVQAGGEYFLIETAPLGGVKVEFFGSGNVRRDQLIEDGSESTWGRIRGGFSSVKLTSAQAQTVKFYVADGEMGRNVFSGSSNVTDRAARLLGIVYGSLGQLAQRLLGGVNVLEVAERGASWGSTFESSTAIGAASNELILAVASNLNGVIVAKGGFISAASAFSGGVSFIADTAAPASWPQGEILAMPRSGYVTTNPTHVLMGALDRPVVIVAGRGIWFRSTSAEGPGSVRHLNYTIL